MPQTSSTTPTTNEGLLQAIHDLHMKQNKQLEERFKALEDRLLQNLHRHQPGEPFPSSQSFTDGGKPKGLATESSSEASPMKALLAASPNGPKNKMRGSIMVAVRASASTPCPLHSEAGLASEGALMLCRRAESAPCPHPSQTKLINDEAEKEEKKHQVKHVTAWPSARSTC